MITEILGIATAGLSLASTILERTSPKEFKEFKKLTYEKIDIEKKIEKYKSTLPSKRIQRHYEELLRSYGNVCKKLEASQSFAELKFKQMGVDTSDS